MSLQLVARVYPRPIASNETSLHHHHSSGRCPYAEKSSFLWLGSTKGTSTDSLSSLFCEYDDHVIHRNLLHMFGSLGMYIHCDEVVNAVYITPNELGESDACPRELFANLCL